MTSTNTPTLTPAIIPSIDFIVKIVDIKSFDLLSNAFIFYKLNGIDAYKKTDTDGNAYLNVPLGKLAIRVEKAGYETLETEITISIDPGYVKLLLKPVSIETTPPPTFLPTNTPAATMAPTPKLNGILTLALVSKQRLTELYGSGRVSPLIEKLKNLLSQETVRGEILDLDQFAALRDKFKTWDNDSNNLAQGTQTDPRENVKKANAAADTIKSILGSKRLEEKYAKVQYIMIIGSDAVIPFYRTSNQSRSTSSEFNYYKTLDRVHPLAVALSQDNILTDDYYADAAPTWMNKETDMELYLPNDLITGRLVETPEEIGTMIDAYLECNGQNRF